LHKDHYYYSFNKQEKMMVQQLLLQQQSITAADFGPAAVRCCNYKVVELQYCCIWLEE